jgi:hypothetical protein
VKLFSSRNWFGAVGIVVLQVSLSWGWGGSSPQRPTPPAAQPEQKTAEVPAAPKPTATGVGRFEVTGVDYYLQNASSFDGYKESSQRLKGDTVKDSVIVIRGTIHGNGIPGPTGKGQAATFHPFFTIDTLLPGLPKSCRAEVITYPQSTTKSENYMTYISFKETAVRPECWEYFRTLKTVPLELKAIRTGAGAKIPSLPVIYGESRTLELGPLLPKSGGK